MAAGNESRVAILPRRVFSGYEPSDACVALEIFRIYVDFLGDDMVFLVVTVKGLSVGAESDGEADCVHDLRFADGVGLFIAGSVLCCEEFSVYGLVQRVHYYSARFGAEGLVGAAAFWVGKNTPAHGMSSLSFGRMSSGSEE